MENIEELKLANEKLNARLAKAVEVFKEQKANIDALTKENEELKNASKDNVVSNEELDKLVADKENFNKQLNEYELKLQKSEADYKDLKKVYEDEQSEYENKITLLEEDNIKLSEQNHLLEEKIQQNLEVSKNYNDQLLTIDELTKQNEDLQKQLNEYELKLQNSENTCEELQKQYELSEKQIAKLMDYQSFQSNQITTLQNEKESLYKQIDEYELKLKDSETTYEQLNKKYEERKKQVAELMGIQSDQSARIEKLQIEKSDLEVNINDLTNRLSESVNGKTKYEEFTEMIIGLVESFNNNGNNIDTDKHSSITVNTYKNSTGSQFMSDAPGMNI